MYIIPYPHLCRRIEKLRPHFANFYIEYLRSRARTSFKCMPNQLPPLYISIYQRSINSPIAFSFGKARGKIASEKERSIEFSLRENFTSFRPLCVGQKAARGVISLEALPLHSRRAFTWDEYLCA